MVQLAVFAGVLSLAGSTTAAAIGEYAHTAGYVAVVPGSVRATGGILAGCTGQSCAIADVSGSTGQLPKVKPDGGDANGYKCIARYNPEGVQAASKAPAGPKQNTGLSGALTGAIAAFGSATTYIFKDKGSYTGRCAKNLLFFARGTTETGTLGITVGPVLSAALSGKDWAVTGVDYNADFAGDNCLGLPGGMVARDMINQAAVRCPDSKIFMSGYSEGGMVSHNGVAYANDEAKKHVAVSVMPGVFHCRPAVLISFKTTLLTEKTY
jgi:hypothetical protein